MVPYMYLGQLISLLVIGKVRYNYKEWCDVMVCVAVVSHGPM